MKLLAQAQTLLALGILFASTASLSQIDTSATDFYVSQGNTLYGYSYEGDQLFSRNLVSGPYDSLRDIVAISETELGIYIDRPFEDDRVDIFNTEEDVADSYALDGLGGASNGTLGTIISVGDELLVNDSGHPTYGIAKLNLLTKNWTDSISNDNNVGFIDLALGFNGFIYGLQNQYGEVEKIDPVSLEVVKSINLGRDYEMRAIAVDQAGFIFIVTWEGEIIRYDSKGEFQALMKIDSRLSDVDLNAEGQIIATGADKTVFILDRVLDSYEMIALSTLSSDTAFVGFSETRDKSRDLPSDGDSDSVPDDYDNCPSTPNTGQQDLNMNGIGAACEDEVFDSDKDGVRDRDDNCRFVDNPEQEDVNKDGVGDACEADLLLQIIPSLAAITIKREEQFGEPAMWAIKNQLCCPNSSNTFKVDIDGQSQTQTNTQCVTEGPSDYTEFRNIRPGMYTIDAKMDAGRCTSKSFNFDYRFRSEGRYKVRLSLGPSPFNSPTIYIRRE
jgi:hypothetical protein